MKDIGQQTTNSGNYETPEKYKEVNLLENNRNSSELPLNRGEKKKTASFSPTSEYIVTGKTSKKLTISGVFDEGRSLKKSAIVEPPSNKRLIVPCIEHKDFNHIPYVFLLIMNRFWDNLFKRIFLNERVRVRNMLALQEVMYIEMSKYILPTAIKILEDREMEELPQSDLFDRNVFDPGQEYDLCADI